MIINGNFCPETHMFKTAEAARAFCRVHSGFWAVTCGDEGYAAITSPVIISSADNKYCISGGSDLSIRTASQVEVSIRERRLSYKNIIKACIRNSLLGTKYKIGYGEELPSKPVIFTYGIGSAAPELTLWIPVCILLSILLGTSFVIPSVIGISVVTAVELLIPWINSYSVDPIEEPWLLPWLPVDD